MATSTPKIDFRSLPFGRESSILDNISASFIHSFHPLDIGLFFYQIKPFFFSNWPHIFRNENHSFVRSNFLLYTLLYIFTRVQIRIVGRSHYNLYPILSQPQYCLFGTMDSSPVLYEYWP